MQAAAPETYPERTDAVPAVQPIQEAARVPHVTRREAYELARAEYKRMLALIQSLDGDDWQRPTACTLWDVRTMVSHVVGALAGYASLPEFIRQMSPRSHKPYRGRFTEQVDLINAVQVGDRRGRSPQELILELRAVGPKALRARSRIPIFLRILRVPTGTGGSMWTGYVLDIIYTRDQWMHRLDICRATGREMSLTPEHDGRIVALVMRDLAHSLAGKLGGASVLYDLQGAAGGMYKVGEHQSPTATITMDVLDFNVLASGRMKPNEASDRGLVQFEGDAGLAGLALQHTTVLY